jgi:hypothetical protein
MRLRSLAFAVLAFGLFSSSANAQWWYGISGNQEGGLIPWSPGIERVAVQLATSHCAGYNKVAYITGAIPGYGNYISFTCRFHPRYDPVKARTW